MESNNAVAALAALAQESRLQVFRRLVQAGPQGLAAGHISRITGIPPSSLSFHLKELTHARLAESRQDGRHVYYRVNFGAAHFLLQFLTLAMTPVTIYHNPRCGTSRNTLGLIRNAGIEPQVIEYLQTPPDRATLQALIRNAGLTVRDALRQKGTPYDALGLANPDLTDEQLLDAMLAEPVLINRPFVVTERGTRLCRPSELVLDILPAAQKGPFTKEDGSIVTVPNPAA